jgi:tetratricopeptide (TPR) repeat protein
LPTPRSTSAEARAPAGTASFPGDDAPSLFAAANAERKLGDVAGALRSYADLERRFPNTAEARLSHVLVARLLLRRGDFAGSLAHFDSYLAVDRNGTLVEEVLQGRAQALRALGRTTEERQALRELLERFPNSIQARAAKERLAPPP